MGFFWLLLMIVKDTLGTLTYSMCKISVIIPVYNKSKYLIETVNCILGQTYSDYELLLIDDGSTDDSGILCDRLLNRDNRIKVFHTENCGVGAARNLGITHASGQYICFIDADDYVDKTFLEKMLIAIESQQADLATCGYYEKKYASVQKRTIENNNIENEIYNIIRYNVLCTSWNKLYVREKIQHLFIENLSTAEDSLFCVQYFLDNDPKIAYVNEILYGYIRYDDGLSAHLRKGALQGVQELYKSNIKLLSKIPDKEIQTLAIHHIYKNYFYGIYTFIFENICDHPFDRSKLAIVSKIISGRKYRKIIKKIFRYPFYDKRAEKTTNKETLYILFSLLKMKRAILLLARMKKFWDKYKK